MKLFEHKLTYVVMVILLWALPLTWIVPTYFITVPVACRPNMVAWWSCFTVGYFGPPGACAPIGIIILLATIWLVIRIIKTTKW
jgi:hypothetical protein